MTTYGYLDMPEGYSDVADWQIEATCTACGETVETCQENCWRGENGEILTDCMCDELE